MSKKEEDLYYIAPCQYSCQMESQMPSPDIDWKMYMLAKEERDGKKQKTREDKLEKKLDKVIELLKKLSKEKE